MNLKVAKWILHIVIKFLSSDFIWVIIRFPLDSHLENFHHHVAGGLAVVVVRSRPLLKLLEELSLVFSNIFGSGNQGSWSLPWAAVTVLRLFSIMGGNDSKS